MLAENVNRASAGFKKRSLAFRKIALESTLRLHNGCVGRRVSERIESCTQSQRASLWADLLACPSRVRESSPGGSRAGTQTSAVCRPTLRAIAARPKEHWDFALH